MYLSDRDIHWAIEKGLLIIDPPPFKYDPTSVDLHLDRVEEAKVWDIEQFRKDNQLQGHGETEVGLGSFKYVDFAGKYLISPPMYEAKNADQKVGIRGEQVLVRPNGFLLWQTKEIIGTPVINPSYICFVDGKSTRARTGILVHLTAPTIHAGWSGKIVLEIANLGPFTFVLEEDDVIAQLTIAMVSSAPNITHEAAGTQTHQQTHVEGRDRFE